MFYDIAAQTTSPVSLNAAGTALGSFGSSAEGDPVISADGRFVAFVSSAGDLIAGGSTLASGALYVRDLTNGVTERLDVNAAGTGFGGANDFPSISADGRFVAFQSNAQNLVSGFVDGNATASSPDVYVRDLLNDVTILLSRNAAGNASGNGPSTGPVNSGDGSIVYFVTEASNLPSSVPDENGFADVYSSSAHLGVGVGSALTFTSPAGGPNAFTLRRNADKLELIKDSDGSLLASEDLADISMALITGAANTNDQLTIDIGFGGGFRLSQGIQFIGGDAGTDRLVIRGGNFTSATYDVTAADAGQILLADATNPVGIFWSGLEGGGSDTSTAANRVFRSQLLDGDVQVRLSGSGGVTLLDAAGTGAFAPISFANPSGSLTVEAGNGNDTITIAGFAAGFSATTRLLGGFGNDRLDAAGAAASVHVTLIDGFGDDTLIGHAGNTTFHLTPGSADTINDSAGSDTLDFSDAFAPITIDLDLVGVAQAVDIGANTVTLNGVIENFVGSSLSDTVSLNPLAVARSFHGGADANPEFASFDRLLIGTRSALATNSGTVINVPGFAAIAFTSAEQVSQDEPPVAVDDEALAQFNTLVTINARINDTDAESDVIIIAQVTQPDHGDVTITANGQLLYTPDTGFFGADEFTYTNRDALGAGSTAEVLVEVNASVSAVADTATILEDTPTFLDLLDNDTNPDDDSLEITSFTQPSRGQVTDTGFGLLQYAPRIDFFGADSFTYTVSDGRGSTSTATVSLTVLPQLDTDSDGDGISDLQEAEAPDADGNNDDTPDAEQPHVTSFLSEPGALLTLVAPAGLTLIDVALIDNPDPNGIPDGVSLPLGLFEFHLSGLTSGAATTVTLLLPDDVETNTYLKFGPTADNPVPHFYEFLFDGTTGAELLDDNHNGTTDRIVLHLVDGGRGDSDLAANGVIADPGAPGEITFNPITLTLAAANANTRLQVNAGTNHVELVNAATSAVLLDLTTAAVTQLTINGGREDNRLTVDFTNGNPLPSDGLFFNGGRQRRRDDLVLTGGAFEAVTHTFSNRRDGTVTFDGSTIAYTGLEPITDNLAAVDRVFEFAATNDSITLADAARAVNGRLKLSSVRSSEAVEFVAPTGSLTIRSGAGNDSVTIRSLDALFVTSNATLVIEGGNGNDSVNTSPVSKAVTLRGGAGRDVLRGGSADDVLEGGADRDLLFGNRGNDTLSGDAGRDDLRGGDGDDSLSGGDGDDSIRGDAGADRLFGDNDNDTLRGDGGDDILLGGADQDMLFGGSDNDVLAGEAGRDSLRGDSGCDTLFGGADNDTLRGGSGNDALLGEDGVDKLVGDGGTRDTLAVGDGRDMLFGSKTEIDETFMLNLADLLI